MCLLLTSEKIRATHFCTWNLTFEGVKGNISKPISMKRVTMQVYG